MTHSTPLPPESPFFTARKQKILSSLSVPSSAYSDLSPKGTVDLALRPLIDELNAFPGLVTTSSCAGRASVFLAGSSRKARPPVQGGEATVASAGGKGGGGRWLYVSHRRFGEDGNEGFWKRQCLDNEDGEEGNKGEICGSWVEVFRLRGIDVEDAIEEVEEHEEEEKRLIHFKFEPMILHVLTSSLTHAQLLLRSAQTSGFRESGVSNVAILNPPTSASITRSINDTAVLINGNVNNNPQSDITSHPGALHTSPPDPLPMVAIRTAGLSFESLVGVQTGHARRCIVSEDYLDTLVHVANARFAENQKRIERFREAFRQILTNASTIDEESKWTTNNGADATQRSLECGEPGWEDKDVRRERKRAEGLRRQEEVKRAKEKQLELEIERQGLQLDQGNSVRRKQGEEGEEGGRLEESGDSAGEAETRAVEMIGNLAS